MQPIPKPFAASGPAYHNRPNGSTSEIRVTPRFIFARADFVNVHPTLATPAGYAILQRTTNPRRRTIETAAIPIERFRDSGWIAAIQIDVIKLPIRPINEMIIPHTKYVSTDHPLMECA
jgi:hypothetical protein